MQRIVWMCVLVLVVGLVPCMADDFYFTYSDSDYSLQGILTASPIGGGAYLATSVSGTVTWLIPTPMQTYSLLLVPPGTVPQNHNGDNIYGQDDLLFPNNPAGQLLTVNPSYFGDGGLEFAVAAPPPLTGFNGGSDIALFATGQGDYGTLESADLGGYAHITARGQFSLTAVPEPSAIILLITTMAGLAVLVPRSRRRWRE